MNEDRLRILEGHVLDKIAELEDESVNMCITSPPYWGLRDYGDGATTVWGGNPHCDHAWGEHQTVPTKVGTQGYTEYNKNPKLYELSQSRAKYSYNNAYESAFCIYCGAWQGQLGLEPTPQLFIKHLVEIFEAIRPKLRDDGTLWVNLGDTYAGGGGWTGVPDDWDSISTASKQKRFIPPTRNVDIQRKSLIMIPERFAIAMVDNGWVLRNKIIWQKPAPMPSSAKDRFTNDFEYLYFFSKKPKYYFKQQFEPMSEATKERDKYNYNNPFSGQKAGVNPNETRWEDGRQIEKGSFYNEKGRNMRTTWTINTANFPEAHFAVFPRELIRTPIKAGCPEKGIVLDPFMGSGTTAVETINQNKSFIGIEINPKYVKIARQRINRECSYSLSDFF